MTATLHGYTDEQLYALLRDNLRGHASTNPERPFEQICDDVAAWFSIQFRCEMSRAHAVLAVVLSRMADEQTRRT